MPEIFSSLSPIRQADAPVSFYCIITYPAALSRRHIAAERAFNYKKTVIYYISACTKQNIVLLCPLCSRPFRSRRRCQF
jgi:hypothetical protein